MNKLNHRFGNMHSSRKTAMASSKSFSSVTSDIWNSKLPCHLSSIFAHPAFKKRLKHHLFFECLPRYFLSIHWHHALWCHHHIHECKSHQNHLATHLTRSSWLPTISLDFHQNIRLHTGARVNVELLTSVRTIQSLIYIHRCKSTERERERIYDERRVL